MDFSWLEFVGNPYAVIAIIAAIMGFSFKNLLKKIEKPKPGFVITMYGMFLVSILAVGIGGMAIVYLILGTGATDEIIGKTPSRISFFNTAHAEIPLPEFLKPREKIKIVGWVWAGETVKIKQKVEVEVKQQINSQSFELEKLPEVEEIIVTKAKTNLRNDRPQFSWWKLRYELADLISVLPEKIPLHVLETVKIGKQIWLKVEFER